MRAAWRLVLHGALVWLCAVVLAIAAQLLGLPNIGGLSAFGTLAIATAVGLATYLSAKWFDHRPLPALGLHVDARWWADLGAGLAIGALLMTLIFVVERGAGWLTIVGRNIGGDAQGFGVALAEAGLVFVAVGFYEELFSRGYHLHNFAEGFAGKRIGPRLALVLATLASAAVFGLAHIGNDNATWISSLNVAVAGCMLACGLLWTGELALPIGLHISWNFCQGNVFGFPVSGNPMPVRVFAIEQGGAVLVTGGAFGPEAGLIGIVAMVIGVGLIAAWVRLTRGQLRMSIELTGEPSAS